MAQKREQQPQSPSSGPAMSSDEVDSAERPIAVVGIGASAGGLGPISQLLGALPTDTGMAFVIVQHLSPRHDSVLAEILSRSTAMRVVEVHDQPQIRRNCVYVIPPNRNILIDDGTLNLSARPAGPHYPINLFFSALSSSHGHRSIGVVLSGGANDGTAGLLAIKAAGGITFAQDESAMHDGMPRSAIASGSVDFVLPPAEIGREIGRIARQPYVIAVKDAPLQAHGDLEGILAALRQGIGVDFSQYKSNTLHRRIHRRMALRNFTALKDYKTFLEQHPAEVESLYQDILINVTNFFRNPDSFEQLSLQVFPRLFAERSRDDAIRVWVIGCSTGEEAYSLAIALTEFADREERRLPIVVYATDLNDTAIERARRGWYPKSIAHDVPGERLQRFFHESEGGYCVCKEIRELCIFARHNTLADPPFSRMDLVSCRNVLIYLDTVLQRKILPVLHYSLKPTGFLFLGSSETITQKPDLFVVEDAKHRIYSKRPAPVRLDTSLGVTRGPVPKLNLNDSKRAQNSRDMNTELPREAERVLLNRYVPAGVLITADADVLQFRGDTGLYLTPAPGKATHKLFKMAREGLLVPLRAALLQAAKTSMTVQEHNVRVRTNGGFHTIRLSVIPVQQAGTAHRWYWVLFEPEQPRAGELPAGDAPADIAAQPSADAEEVVRLTRELAATRDYLQAAIEQHEAANEELQAANEEVQSANEELQSINEELETSKEEIQSSNEELTTVNEELRHRNDELNRANADLNNIFGGVQLAILMVWRDLRIRRFTPLAEKILSIIPTDVGRSIGDIKLKLNIADLPALIGEVIDNVAPKELEVQDAEGRWYLLRIRPYRTLENHVDGAVVVLVDIDSLKRGKELQERQACLLEQVQEAIFAWEPNGKISYWNHGAQLLYGYSSAEALQRDQRELLRLSDAQRYLDVLQAKGRWNGELTHRTKRGKEIVVESIQVLIDEHGKQLVLQTDRDITPRKALELDLQNHIEELAFADRHKNEFLAMLAHELRNPLAPMRNAVQILKSPRATPEMSSTARELIERQIDNMSHLVTDLLDAARIARGLIELRTQPLDLRSIVKREVDIARAAAELRNQIFSVSVPTEPVMVDGDATRLEQALGNVLGNALKYTPPGGRIGLTLDTARRTGNRPGAEAILTIRDDGVGIAPELLPRIFDLFMQADRSLAHAQGGLGIGLSLVRTLIELHGGSVSADSKGINQGSEFVLRLPLASPTESATPFNPAATVPRRFSAHRILVVDDNPDVADSSATMLSLAGHDVKKALSGRKALEVAKEFHPAVVLLDIGMPDIDGYEVARLMRQTPELRSTCLIAVSGYDTPADHVRSVHAGFDHHVVKPVTIEVLQTLFQGAVT